MSDVSLASALDALLRFGALMLRSGEAAFRVREDMVLLAPRLGIERFSMLVTLTTLTASGTTLNGHSLGWPQVMDIGTVSPWSTCSWCMMVRSKPSSTSDSTRCQARSGSPFTTGTGRGPQPSSAGLNSSPTPIAKVGMVSGCIAAQWSL